MIRKQLKIHGNICKDRFPRIKIEYVNVGRTCLMLKHHLMSRSKSVAYTLKVPFLFKSINILHKQTHEKFPASLSTLLF